MRAFIAIEIPLEITSQLLKTVSPLSKVKNIRWIPPESLHITLHFLGKVDESKIVDIKRFLSYLGSKNQGFTISLGGGGVFPEKGKPQIFWAGVSGEIANLEKIAFQISEGFPKKEDRKFKPHLTLIRTLKNQKVDFVTFKQQFCTLMQSYESQRFQINEIVLMKSHLSSQGSTYSTVARFSLRSGA